MRHSSFDNDADDDKYIGENEGTLSQRKLVQTDNIHNTQEESKD